MQALGRKSVEKQKFPARVAGRAHQFLDLEALLVSQLAARHISCAHVEANRTPEANKERCVAHRAPAPVVEDLQASILSTAVSCDDAVSQANVTLFCTGLTPSVY